MPRRSLIAATAVLAVAVLPLCAQKQVSPKQERKAADAYLEGARALDRDDLQAAEKSFSRAVKLNPAKQEYADALTIAREHRLTALVQQSAQASLSGNLVEAVRLLDVARGIDPANPIVQQHFDQIGEIAPPRPPEPAAVIPQLAGPILLDRRPGVISLHQRGGIREFGQRIGSEFGIKVALDPELPSATTRVDLDAVSFDQAWNILGQLFHVFTVPLDEHTLYVVRDIPENHTRYEHLYEETVYLPGLTNEQMTEIGNIVRQVFDIRQATVQTGSANLVVRAPEQSLKAMNAILTDLIDGGSEVLLDVKVYALDTSRTRNVGIILPTQLNAFNLAAATQSLIKANQSLIDQLYASGIFTSSTTPTQIALYLIAAGLGNSSLFTNAFLTAGGGITTTVFSAALTPTLNLGYSSSDIKALDTVRLRVHDRDAATFRAGTRYPIQTALFSDIATSNVSNSLLSQYLGGAAATSALANAIPQIQYEDLGLTLKATPTIQKTGDVHVKLDLKIEALAGRALNDIPVLANRAYSSDVTLHDAETIVLVSGISQQEASAVSGLPGLSELPGFRGTTNKQTSKSNSELLILLTPHIVRKRNANGVGPQIPFNTQAAAN